MNAPSYHIRTPAERKIIEAAAELLNFKVIDGVRQIDGYIIAAFLFEAQSVMILDADHLWNDDLSVPSTPEEIVVQLVAMSLD